MIKQVKFNEKIVSVLAAFLIYGIVLVPNSFAHNIDLDKAWEMGRDYARIVRKESPRRWLHYATNCVNAFPGHNHIVRCVAQFQNEKDSKLGIYGCTETFEFYLNPHRDKPLDYSIFARQTSRNKCGLRSISDVQIAGGISY